MATITYHDCSPPCGYTLISTRDNILDAAQDLMQVGGYHAFSLNQVAERVGIRKPSIVHHFPSKQSLAEAVVKRYVDGYAKAVLTCLDTPGTSACDALDVAFAPYLEYSMAGDRICLGGALGGEFAALPVALQQATAALFDGSRALLAQVLEKGVASGEFQPAAAPDTLAGIIVDTLQGALLQARATGDGEHLKRAAGFVIEHLLGVGKRPTASSRHKA